MSATADPTPPEPDPHHVESARRAVGRGRWAARRALSTSRMRRYLAAATLDRDITPLLSRRPASAATDERGGRGAYALVRLTFRRTAG